MIGECPNAGPECPYFNRATQGALHDTQEHGCYTDTDHTLPKFMGKCASKLVQNYIRSRANKHQLCRNEHDKKTLEEFRCPPEIPDERFMIDAIIKARKRNRNGKTEEARVGEAREGGRVR